MKSELSFLLELVLDEQVPQTLKTRLVTRIREVEKNYFPQEMRITPKLKATASQIPLVAAQAPSMQRLMENNPDLVPKPPVPVTPQAANALMQRQALMNGALNEKPEQGRKGPRKF